LIINRLKPGRLTLQTEKLRIKLRKDEGCVAVETEMAAFLAVAHFRQVQFGQILYGGDDISGSEWDNR